MTRVVLIHWKAEEAEARVEQLKRAGIAAEWMVPGSGEPLRAFRENPPDAFLIDLTRVPSQGQAVAVALRRQAATRKVPLVFAGGAPEKVERVKRVLPDAAYLVWEGLPGALRAAIRQAPQEPAVPGVMDAYSGAPLAQKLGIRAGSLVALLGAPEGFESRLAPLPDGARTTSRARSADRVLCFVRSRKDLERRFPGAAQEVKQGGSIWIVWPKQASGVETDLTQIAVRRFGLDAGWVDYKICAVDETWSGLAFARRAGLAR